MKKLLFCLLSICMALPAFAESLPTEEKVVDVESYEVQDSVFQKIADLEQEKVLMQLEKEKAQLQLDLDRLAAEQARLVREQQNADLRAEEQAAALDRQKQELELEKQKMAEQKQRMAEEAARAVAKKENAVEMPGVDQPASVPVYEVAAESDTGVIAEKYFLVEIVGAGSQLVATVEDIMNGRTKKISVGKDLDGYTVKSISLDDGVEFEKDGKTAILGVGSFAIDSAESSR